MNGDGWKPTGEAKPDGRPIYVCGHAVPCRAKVWGWKVGEHRHDGGEPKARQVVVADSCLPCVYRGEPAGKIRKSMGCDCWAVVFLCNKADDGICTLAFVDGDVGGKKPWVCVDCKERQEG